MKIKLSDFVASYLSKIGVDTVFAVSGGASLHLIHSVADNPNMSFVTPHHEQAAAMAADGYARTTNNIGVAIATSGPGATNLITGICCSYYDSVPVLFITGQVSTFRMTGTLGVRQIGFQETPIVEICKPITKYSVTISDPNLILYELEKALSIAKSGRPGPVLLDIPDNLQRAYVDEKELKGYLPISSQRYSEADEISGDIDRLMNLILASERPILVGGWGLHLSGTEKQFVSLAESLNIPVVLTWGAADVLSNKHPLYIGTFGTHGTRHANFAIQNSDLVISLGSRLDSKATGTPVNSFARSAKKVIVDIDINELNKFKDSGLTIDIQIHALLQDFFIEISKKNIQVLRKKYVAWSESIQYWRSVSEQFSVSSEKNSDFVDPYRFIKNFSRSVSPEARVFVDTGCSIAWTMQASEFNGGVRVWHDCNNTAMGWALPAAIGSYFAKKEGPIYCIVGDGSFMMTMHELATIKHHKIPIKILIMNNAGYGMIQQTQDQWLSSNYYASSYEGGLSFPNYEDLAKSFNLDYLTIGNEDMLSEDILRLNSCNNAFICNIIIAKSARVIPQVKFGCPNEDMEPLLPRNVFEKCMIISEDKPTTKSNE